MKIKRTILIILGVFGLYFGLYFAVMDWDVPVWKDGRFVNTCAVRWGEERPFIDGRLGRMSVRAWHPLNVVFAPAEDTVNTLRGWGSRDEILRKMNEEW